MKSNSLQLTRMRRQGGAGITERDYLDFVIDGRLLSEQIGGDLVTCLGWAVASENTRAVRRLLLDEPADFPNGRRSLYVCPECGDLGCGAVSAVIENVDNQIMWRDFGYENDYENIVRLDDYRNLGPFVFDAAEYERVIRRAL
jgi:hypothetical protein